MFSKDRPSVNVFGDASTLGENETPRYYKYANRMQHMHNLGLIRTDDIRMKIDPAEVKSFGLRSLSGLENAAAKIYSKERSKNLMQTAESTDKAALIRAALTASIAQTPEQAETDPKMGQMGVLSRNLEKAALAIHHNDPKDEGPLRILALAAAAHNSGAVEAAKEGFENGSVVEAAAIQNRDPMAVLKDLHNHGQFKEGDIRSTVKDAYMDVIQPEDAAQNIRRQRPQLAETAQPAILQPSARLTAARQAEGRAMAMMQNETGTDFEKETRRLDAKKLFVSALVVERQRQTDAKTQETQAEKPKGKLFASARKRSGGER